MDKTHNISLGGFSFVIEDKAYRELSNYLNEVSKFLGNSPDTQEIIYDIEQRMAELLKERMKGREVIVSQDVTYLIEILGTPEQYTLDEDETSQTQSVNSQKTESTFERVNTYLKHRKLYRDIDGKKLGGVLSGLSHYLNFDVAWLRVIYLVLLILSQSVFIISKLSHFELGFTFVGISGFWLIAYIVFWILVPPAETSAEKLEMQGKSVTIDTLSSFKTEEKNTEKRLFRNLNNKMLGGVLSGLSEYFSFQTTWVRIIFIALVLGLIPFIKASSAVVIMYFIFWIAIPSKPISPDENNNQSTENQEDNTNNFHFQKEKETDFSSEENRPNSQQNFYQANENQSYMKRETSSFRQTRQGCWGFLRAIFKGILYLVMGIGIFILGILLLSLIVALLGVGVAGWGVGFSLLMLNDYLSFLVEGNWQQWVTYLSVFSLLILPISVISILCLKFFSKNGYKTPKGWILTNVFLFFFGIMGGLVGVIDTIKYFRTDNFVEERFEITPSDTLSLSYEKEIFDNFYSDSILNFDDYILKDDDKLVKKGNSIQYLIKPTQEAEPYIVVKKHSKGRTLSDAKEKAEKIIYNLKINGAKITLPKDYSLGKNPKIRNQRIRVHLYLPEGKFITSPNQYIRVYEPHVHRTTNIGNNKVAKMTKEGLILVEK